MTIEVILLILIIFELIVSIVMAFILGYMFYKLTKIPDKYELIADIMRMRVPLPPDMNPGELVNNIKNLNEERPDYVG